MLTRNRIAPLLVVLAVALGACAPRPGPSTTETADAYRSPAQPTRLTAAILADPPVITPKIEKVLPGSEAMEVLVNSALAVNAGGGALSPQLAERVPSVENGLWKVLPDGTMETTWTIKPNVVWHDGTPFTSADLAFTATVGMDPATPYFRHAGYKWVESVETPDPRTVTVRWAQPYTSADLLFTSSLNNALYTAPLPKHLLERVYLEDKANILDAPYWTDQFVGTGPYRVRQFVRGSHVLLDANDQYVLGRPKIDTIELKFISDKDTLISNVLSGTVELTLGRGLSLEEALNAAGRWSDGKAEFGILNWLTMFPQFINTDPPIVTNVTFRKALMHAIDRQEMVDTIQRGVVPVAHSYLSPNDPSYKEVEPSIVRYEFDPRRATQLIESLGYARGADGIFRDPAGQRLSIEARTTGENSIHRPAMLSIADYWQRVGVGVEPVFIPPQRAADREYRATFPAIELLQHPNGLEGLSRFHSRETSLPENNFTLSGNNGRYRNAEFDDLVDRFFTTIPAQPRTQLLARIMNHITDQVTMMGLFYQTDWLEGIAPVLAARGNNDWLPDDPRVKDVHILDLMGWRLGLIHDLEPEERPIETLMNDNYRQRVDIMVSGHTHFERLDYRNGVLQINSGSAVHPHQYSSRLGTVGLLRLEPNKIEARVVKLGETPGLRNPGENSSSQCRSVAWCSRSPFGAGSVFLTDGHFRLMGDFSALRKLL